MSTDPITASGIIPAPMTIPTANAQNRYTISIGSLIAARKRTIESAPTIPSDNTTLEVTSIITSVVTSDNHLFPQCFVAVIVIINTANQITPVLIPVLIPLHHLRQSGTQGKSLHIPDMIL